MLLPCDCRWYLENVCLVRCCIVQIGSCFVNKFLQNTLFVYCYLVIFYTCALAKLVLLLQLVLTYTILLSWGILLYWCYNWRRYDRLLLVIATYLTSLLGNMGCVSVRGGYWWSRILFYLRVIIAILLLILFSLYSLLFVLLKFFRSSLRSRLDRKSHHSITLGLWSRVLAPNDYRFIWVTAVRTVKYSWICEVSLKTF
jgi:hypothetical protein